ncbi:MAG: aspartyl/asparaginyl beta-hydroxylase domain-containing protein [Rhodospirillaceae bacterium]|nr:aspartyl/asparaginyl beta-hydroxylase domain-containing protein [Rhodospirillaceae bacterium]
MWAEALSAKFIILYVFILSAVFVHYRGRERHRFTRQLTDHSTFMAPINVFMYLFSAVPNKPILDRDRFPELDTLRDNWRTIREEALALFHQGEIKRSETFDDLAFNSFFKKGWKRFYLKWYDEIYPSALDSCPQTVALLEKVPSLNAAMFTMLPPGSELVRHRDPYAGSLRYHLGLVTPNDDRCRIYIDGTPYSWRDGDDIVFDETYIHRAMNESDLHRLILFCDIARPMRYRFADAVNRFFCRRLLRAAATKNTGGEKVGVLNRLFGYIYPLRLKAKALKKRNRQLYYALKYLQFGTIFFLIFYFL